MKHFVQKVQALPNGIFKLSPRETYVIKLTGSNAKAVRRFLREGKIHFMANLTTPLFVIRHPDGAKIFVRKGEWLIKRPFYE